eukprot:TRINITY_DN64253_c0_g1_i1.p1 TRINITY_DN64253_c0_g1~~TRINITY_DN64253_c0_g1_i1.p1  ORF type:complete len:805 (+),score=99.70 TRINITY_DN64253_c0_g1_i1:156-2417(+)
MTDVNKVANPYPAPGSTVQGGPSAEISCDAAVIVYNQDVHFPITVKLGNYILAQNLKAPGYSGLFCTTAPNFPNPPANSLIEVTITGSNTVLFKGPPPGGFVAKRMATQLTVYHPYNPVGPSTPSPNPFMLDIPEPRKVADPPAKPPVPPQVGLKVSNYQFSLSPANLFNGKPGGVKWPMHCNSFYSTDTYLGCTLLPINMGSYPAVGEVLSVDAEWTIFNTDGTTLRKDPLQYPKGGTVGQFTYYGFVTSAPHKVSAYQLVQFQGHFDDVSHTATDYTCDFSCHNGGTIWAKHVAATTLTASFLACPAPDFTGVKYGMSCTLGITFTVTATPYKAITLPFTGPTTFQFEQTAIAHPVGLVKTVTEQYIKPGDKISVSVSSSCDALMIWNDYNHAKPLTVVFNDTDWVDNLAYGEVSQLKCMNYLPPAKADEQVPIKIYPQGEPNKPIFNEKSKASWWAAASSKFGSWTIMKISSYKGNVVLVPDSLGARGLACALVASGVTQPWPMKCPPPPAPATSYPLGQEVQCDVPERMDDGSYPPANSDGSGTTFIHTSCSVLFPDPKPQTPWPLTGRTDLTFYQDELPYAGFIVAPTSKEGLKIGTEWFANGVFDTDVDNFRYNCVFSHSGMIPVSTQATSVTSLQIHCPTPGITAYPSYPITVTASITQTHVKTGITFTLPQTGPLEIIFVTTNPPANNNGPSANIHVTGKSSGNGGKTAGIVIGVLLGIVVIIGGVGAYFYFVRTKKHQGFVAIQ